jgi:hypothetical protein
MAIRASPELSQSEIVFECAELTITNGPYPEFGGVAKKATKNSPVGVGSATVPIPAGAA